MFFPTIGSSRLRLGPMLAAAILFGGCSSPPDPAPLSGDSEIAAPRRTDSTDDPSPSAGSSAAPPSTASPSPPPAPPAPGPSSAPGKPAPPTAGAWTQRPGAAYDIGVGADGSVWAIGTNAVSGGFGIYRWNETTWEQMPGGAIRIAVGPTGRPWVVNDSGHVFEWMGTDWAPRPGSAIDVGVGADGSVWVIGTNRVPGGFGIYRWTGGSWETRAGGAVRIAVSTIGDAWVVNDAGAIFEGDGTTWQQRPGVAHDVGIGADGSVWIVGTTCSTQGCPDATVPGGYAIHLWDRSTTTWTGVDGGAVAIAAGPNGRPWVVTDANAIFQRL